MRLIIAGGRNYVMTDEDTAKLDELPTVTEVVSGAAAGADVEGERWARDRRIPVRRFYADWYLYGQAAGPIRNRQMAEYADGVVLFSGGRGTMSMFKEARRTGIIIYDWREDAKFAIES